MEATSAHPILLPGLDHLPCLQEIRSVKGKPFYCFSSVGTIPLQGQVSAVSRASLFTACLSTADAERLSAATFEP